MSISWSWKESAVSAKRRRAIERNAGRGTNGTLHGIEEEEKPKGGRETETERLNSDSRSTPSIALGERAILIYACYMPGAQRGRGTIIDTCLSVVNRIRLRCRSGNLLRWALASFCHAVKRAVQLGGRPTDRGQAQSLPQRVENILSSLTG